jgi:2-aminoadipate transaminase
MQPISFARGAPSLDIIDVEGLKAAAVRAFEADPAGVTAYGNGYGYLPLRKWIAEQHRVPVERVLITNGSLQADAFLFEQLVRAGSDVVVERPTYDRTLLNLRAMRARIHQLSLQPDGLDVDELRKLLESGVRPTLAHVIPNHQNPAGVTLSLAKREQLVGLAAEFDLTLFEDDPYADIRFRGERLPSLLSLDAGGDRVVHASSFTKTVCPGVRVGYLIGPPGLISDIARLATSTYISPVMLSAATVYQFCQLGYLRRSIETVRTALAERARVLAAELREQIPGIRFTEPDGGYFLWVELPTEVDASRVVAAAEQLGVTVVRGADFLLEGGQNALRLAFSAVGTDQIAEGVRRLAGAIDAVSRAKVSDS